MEARLFHDANEMEPSKMYSVIYQVVNAGVLTKMAKKYLRQGLRMTSSALNKVSETIETNLISENISYSFANECTVLSL